MLGGSFEHENQNLSFGSRVSPHKGKGHSLDTGDPANWGPAGQDELVTKEDSAPGLGSWG